ncbi:disulfide bond formation protein B [Endozoicomonas sp. ALD040]|uniref:disulfide bond formation protein B n=1 Tax=unclassified Endozoicomonas TaxID=2644528 RepID=UPI003BB166B2
MIKTLVMSRYIRPLGWIAIAICAVTWWMDLTEIVKTCPFCRTERTAIGLLGVLMVLPHYRYISIFLTCLFSVVGLVTASQHLFLMIKSWHFSLNTPLVIIALCLLCGELLLLIERALLSRKSLKQ